MCGRLVITLKESEIAERLRSFIELDIIVVPPSDTSNQTRPSYNVAPSATIPVVTEVNNRININTYRWGLIPHWAKDDAMANKCFNARSETMSTKPTFRKAFSKSRCIVPVTGYYEWLTSNDGTKHPMYITTKNNGLLYLAGLCEPTTHSATIATKESHGELRTIHTRQPVYLDKSDILDWVNPSSTNEDMLLLAQTTPFDLEFYRVSTQVNSVRNNNETLIIPISN